MIIIGERINTSRKAIAPAVAQKDSGLIAAEAQRQWQAGATYLDVNCGTMVEGEPDYLEWLVQTVQTATNNAPCALDSPNPEALQRALQVHQGQPIINSITAENQRLQTILPLVTEYQARIIALTMDDQGMPETVADRLRIAAFLVESLTQAGVALPDIFIDPLIRPISTGGGSASIVFETIRQLKQEFPGVNTIGGLSNISFGLPVRPVINQAFLVLALQAGLDAAILDPLDRRLRSLIFAAELLLEQDEYAANYIAAFREGKLTGQE